MMAALTPDGYFVFYPHVQLVRGRRGAAIYELFGRKVYWLGQPQIARALTRLALADSIPEAAAAAEMEAQALATYLAVLSDLGLGIFSLVRSAAELYRPVLLRSQAEEHLIPRDGGSLTVEITGECVYDCPWCTSRNVLTPQACACGVWPDQGPPLPLDRLLDAFQQLSYAGVRTLVVRGGEPLLAAGRLCDLVTAACRLGMRCEVHSTGALLDRECAGSLRGLPVHFYLMIPDTDESTFDRAVGRPGSWAGLQEVVSALAKAGIPFSAKIPAQPARLERAHATAAWARELGATGISPLYYLAQPESSPDEFKRTFRCSSPQDMSVDLQEFIVNGQSQFCFDNSYFISGDGRLTPCIASRAPLANLAETGMAAILREDRLEPVRHTARLDMPACQACEFRMGCRACLVRSGQLMGSAGSRHWNCGYEPDTGSWL